MKTKLFFLTGIILVVAAFTHLWMNQLPSLQVKSSAPLAKAIGAKDIASLDKMARKPHTSDIRSLTDLLKRMHDCSALDKDCQLLQLLKAFMQLKAWAEKNKALTDKQAEIAEAIYVLGHQGTKASLESSSISAYGKDMARELQRAYPENLNVLKAQIFMASWPEPDEKLEELKKKCSEISKNKEDCL